MCTVNHFGGGNASSGEIVKMGRWEIQFKSWALFRIMSGESSGNNYNIIIPCLREHNTPCFVRY